MCKDTTNIRNEQVQTNFFDLFEAKKRVEVGFSAPDMTNLGGLPIISRINKKDDLLVQLTRKIVEWRNPKLIDHSIKEMVTQRVNQIAAGYEDADDCDVLRNDSMMKLASGRLSQRTAAWVARAEEQYRRTGQDVKVYYRFMYRATRWARAQWIVVKIEFGSLGRNVRYVVTDMYDKKPRDVYENWYCKRGRSNLFACKARTASCT